MWGVEIRVSPHCVEMVVGDRKFPASRHRSRRIHKKLVRRHGGEYHVVAKPTAYRVGNVIYMHPKIYEDLKKCQRSSSPNTPGKMPGLTNLFF